MAAKTTTKKMSKDGKTLTITTDRRKTIIKHVAADLEEIRTLTHNSGPVAYLAADELTLLRLADLARINSTNAEMAAALCVDQNYFNKFVTENPIVSKTIEQHKSNFKASLRRTQAQVAIEDKNVPMLIHLGKTVLQQTEAKEVKHSGGISLLSDIMNVDVEATIIEDDDDE